MYRDDSTHENEYSIECKEYNSPIWSNYKDPLIDGQILAIAASHIEPNSTGCQILQETFHNRPRLKNELSHWHNEQNRETDRPCTAWTRNAVLFVGIPRGHYVLRRPRGLFGHLASFFLLDRMDHRRTITQSDQVQTVEVKSRPLRRYNVTFAPCN